MDRWPPHTDQKQLLNLTYRAGLRELFEPYHDPLPYRMAELTERIAGIDHQREDNLSFTGNTLAELWRDDEWP
jgi:hypothetical protein